MTTAPAPRVLVVDDEPQIARGLKIILRSAGYAVEHAATKQEALDAGADDYVTKPFGTDELLARLRAVLRRSNEAGGSPRIEVLGGVVIDLHDRRVTVGGEDIHLTPIEFDLLRVLAHHRGRLVTHRQLLQEVWGPEYHDETHYLRVHIAHIRAKLEPDPSRPRGLVTEPGVGYRLSGPDGPDS
jgi:two-component system KDP operon response regulator KdpE